MESAHLYFLFGGSILTYQEMKIRKRLVPKVILQLSGNLKMYIIFEPERLKNMV